MRFNIALLLSALSLFSAAMRVLAETIRDGRSTCRRLAKRGTCRQLQRIGNVLQARLDDAERFRIVDHRLASTFNEMGLLYHDFARYKGAEMLFQSSIRISERMDGKNSLNAGADLQQSGRDVLRSVQNTRKRTPCANGIGGHCVVRQSRSDRSFLNVEQSRTFASFKVNGTMRKRTTKRHNNYLKNRLKPNTHKQQQR